MKLRRHILYHLRLDRFEPVAEKSLPRQVGLSRSQRGWISPRKRFGFDFYGWCSKFLPTQVNRIIDLFLAIHQVSTTV